MNQRSKIGVCSCQDIVGIKTPIEGTPNPDIEPGIGTSLMRVSKDSPLWEFNSIFFKNYDSGCVTVCVRTYGFIQ